jgi:hypothetical protein
MANSGGVIGAGAGGFSFTGLIISNREDGANRGGSICAGSGGGSNTGVWIDDGDKGTSLLSVTTGNFNHYGFYP